MSCGNVQREQRSDRAVPLVEAFPSWPFPAALIVLPGAEKNQMEVKINATGKPGNSLKHQFEWVTALLWEKKKTNQNKTCNPLGGKKSPCSLCLIQHWKAGKQILSLGNPSLQLRMPREGWFQARHPLSQGALMTRNNTRQQGHEENPADEGALTAGTCWSPLLVIGVRMPVSALETGISTWTQCRALVFRRTD